MSKKILAIVPARAGSKGLYKKNIRTLNGKPLIAYTIEAAKKSKYIDRVIVSTEDIEFKEISKFYGAEVPFLRPDILSKDNTPSIDVIIHSLEYMKNEEKYVPDYVCLLQCTSPFRDVHCLDEAIEKLYKTETDSLVSVCKSNSNPYWMKVIDNGNLKEFIKSDKILSRRQDLPIVYNLNGAIYICKTEILLNKKSWYTNKTIAYVMDEIKSIDIDNDLDFRFAEFMMKEMSD